MAEEQTALGLRHVTKLYAGTMTLEDVSLTIRCGEVHGLIGKNRVGESIPVDIISGLVTPSSREIWIGGQKYTSLSPTTARHQHISIIMQEPQITEESTVMENFSMPGYLDSRRVIDWSEMQHRVTEILDQASLLIDVSVKTRNLSTSERQLLLVIKACFVEDTETVTIDKASAFLGQKDQVILYRIIGDLILAGETVVSISRHMEGLPRICDWVTVIRDGYNAGGVMWENPDKKKLASLIVGNTNCDEQVMEDTSAMTQEEEALVLKNFASYGKFRSISMSVREGEIIDLTGLRGSGRTELMKNMIGVDVYGEGTVQVAGSQKHYHSSAAARDDDVLCLTEEREAEGLILIASIQKNLTISILPRVSRWGVLQTKREERLADDLIRILDVKAFSRKQDIGQLSGRNKQKVLVGKTMAYTPQVCLLDEPTHGVDIEAKESILNTIHRELRKQSCVIITSPGVEDLIKICDRVLVLCEGEIVDRFPREEFPEKQIY